MRASVVVTNHDYGRFVAAAIDSALAQTHPDVEVIVVDDGSTDDSRDVIDRFRDRVTVIHKKQGGQTSAMNAGFAASAGELICFLDADDLLAPEALATAAQLLSRPGVVKAHWPMQEIDVDGVPTGAIWPAYPIQDGDLRAELLEDGPEVARFPPHSGNAYARTLLDDVFPLPELERESGRGHASADTYLAMVAAAAGPVAAAPRPLGAYRRHGTNAHLGIALRPSLEHYVWISERHWALLAERLRAQGLEPDLDRWRARSWFYRRRRVLATLDELVPAGEPWILVDDDGTQIRADPRWPIRGLVEHDGGVAPPADDGSAIAEVERLRDEGARLIAFAWVSFWWREHYRGLLAHLEVHYRRVADDELLLAFDLGGQPRRS